MTSRAPRAVTPAHCALAALTAHCALAALAALAGCPPPAAAPRDAADVQCADGVDNDGDGRIDADDRGCANPTDDDERGEPPACSDGVDNDGDGFSDFPDDPGCRLSLDDDEADGCPGTGCPACANGADDDGDGVADFPQDPGCDAAADLDESDPSASACGAASVAPLSLAGEAGEATGELVSTGQQNALIGACGGAGPEAAYALELAERRALLVSTEFAETELDTVIYARAGACRDPAAELGCDDDGGQVGATSRLLVTAEPGTIYVVVDSHLGAAGEYRVRVQTFTARGDPCDLAAPDCAPGLVCRLVDPNAPEPTCEPPP